MSKKQMLIFCVRTMKNALTRVFLLLFCGAALCSSSSVVAKRGFVADGCKGPSCQDATLLGNAGWYYAYNPTDPYQVGGARFTPMHWCLSSLNDTIPSYVSTEYMMGFNEPNNAHNCNTSADTVAKAWGTVMQKWPNSKLVSPATAGNGIPWYDEFFAACKTLYGSNGCSITYLATHDYSCNANTTLAYLSSLHAKYGYPVWLTEFSCGDGAAARPTSDHIAFMKAIIPALDKASFVYRYSWMSAEGANRGLVLDGKLTELGQLYNTL